MIKTKKPLVSVIITTFKRPDYLNRAINSVKDQNYSNIEIIVVDDNDPDTDYRYQTEELMLKYDNDQSIKYIKHAENKNGAAARNTGISHAEGKYVAFLDDDDEYLSGKITKQVEFLENTSEYKAVYCGWIKNDEVHLPRFKGDVTLQLLSGEALIITGSIMMNRETIIAIGGWDETFRRNQEAALMLRFFKHDYKIGFVNEALFKINLDDRSNVSDPKRTEEDFNHFLETHKEQIETSAVQHKVNKNYIYSHRYRGVFMNYLKYGDIKSALKLYLRLMTKIPLRFNKDLLVYTIKKLQGKYVYE